MLKAITFRGTSLDFLSNKLAYAPLSNILASQVNHLSPFEFIFISIAFDNFYFIRTACA